MSALRSLVLTHRRLALLLLVLALAVKLLVPAGYMPAAQAGRTIVVAMCGDTAPITITLPAPGKKGDAHKNGHQAADGNCAFSGLGGPALAGADPVLLAAALIFAFVLAYFTIRIPARRSARHLRPPLRGPPALV